MLGGEVARSQLNNHRHFFSESPRGSGVYRLPPWQALRFDPRVLWLYMAMCAAGMRDSDSGLLIQKMTELWASAPELLEPLVDLQCDGTHEHKVIQGTNSDGVNLSHKCRVWPWEFATRVASGIAALVRRVHHEQQHQPTYPTAASQANTAADTTTQTAVPPTTQRRRSAPGEAARADRLAWTCPGCRSNLARDDPRHDRVVGSCKWHDVVPVHWPCVGCQNNAPRPHSSRRTPAA